MAGKRIAILCEMLYQFDLKLFLAGGGERWAIDFITLLKNNDYIVDVYQFSYEKQTVKYKNHKIRGLGNVDKYKQYDMDTIKNGLNIFYEQTKSYDGIFFLSMNLCQGLSKQPTITVSHGIWWDGYESPVNNGYMFMDLMKTWVRNSTKCISVDTNSIHAGQVYFPRHVNKMEYIPNYVDLNVFKPDIKDYTGNFKVIYPRRIDTNRGYLLMVEVAKRLSLKYDDIEFVFCGRGQEQDENKLRELIKDMPNMKHISYDMSEMYRAYEGMHISCIPTIRAEGTSLSCLESLATGTVPIVTTVGGLTDLVQKNVNGLMINPNSDIELENAIEYCYLNRDKVEEMRNNGLMMIKTFSKERWEQDVLKIVKDVYQ